MLDKRKSETPQKPTKMANVPTDILFMMLAHLSVTELTRIRKASRFFHFLIVECNRIWEIQIKRLTQEQQSGIPSANFRKVIFGRHFLKSNLQKKLVPLGRSPSELVATVGGLFTGTKPATRKPKYLLSQHEALKDIQIDLDKLTEALLSDNADLFISSASRLGVLTPYIAERGNRPQLVTAMQALERNGQVIVCGDVSFVAKLIDEILITKAINCFRLGLKMFLSIVDTHHSNDLPRTYYGTIVNSVFNFDDYSFKIEFFKILFAFGDDSSLDFTLSYLMQNHRLNLTRLFSSNKELFSEVINTYFGSDNCNNVLKLTDFTFATNDNLLLLRLFKSAHNSQNSSIVSKILNHAIKAYPEVFSALYKTNPALFLKIFAKYFSSFLDIPVIYNFVMSLNLEGKFIAKHLCDLELINLNKLLTSSTTRTRPDRESLQKLKEEIIGQFTKIDTILKAAEDFEETDMTLGDDEEGLTVTGCSH